MAFYDWNHNGKKDIQDDFIEYNIYKQSTDKDNGINYPGSSGNSAGCITGVAVIVILFLIGFLFNKCSTSYCKVPGCSSECTIDSEYCLEHDFWDRHYNNPTYYDEYNAKKREEKDSDQKTEEKSTDIHNESKSTPSNYKGTTKSYDDPYDINEYDSPEDFYDDNYDDFWAYEEAEDYYNTYHEDP